MRDIKNHGSTWDIKISAVYRPLNLNSSFNISLKCPSAPSECGNASEYALIGVPAKQIHNAKKCGVFCITNGNTLNICVEEGAIRYHFYYFSELKFLNQLYGDDNNRERQKKN